MISVQTIPVPYSGKRFLKERLSFSHGIHSATSTLLLLGYNLFEIEKGGRNDEKQYIHICINIPL